MDLSQFPFPSEVMRHMMDLSQIPIEQLHEEIQRRETIKQEKPQPLPMSERDYIAVSKLCKAYINHIDEHGFVDEDLKQYIVEAAISAVFGRDVWEWILMHKKGE